MGELVAVTSEMDVEWARMKRSIHLANTVSSSPEEGALFQSMLKRAMASSVGRCKAERKRVRDAETQKDTSDAAIVRAAKFTDALPLADYDRVLHLVPRLVNVRASVLSHHFSLAHCVHCHGTGGHARRSHPRSGVGHQAPVGLARDRVEVFQRLL